MVYAQGDNHGIVETRCRDALQYVSTIILK